MARTPVVGFTDTCTGILRSRCSCLTSDIFTFSHSLLILQSTPVWRKNTKEGRQTHEQYGYIGMYVLPELQVTKGAIITEKKLIECDLCIKINVFHIQRIPSLPSWKVRCWLQFPFCGIIFYSVPRELVEDGSASGFVFIREENQQQSCGSSSDYTHSLNRFV